MLKDSTHYQKTAFIWSILFATIGLLAALLLIFALGALSIISDILPSIIAGIIALYAAAAFFGNIAGILIYKFRGRIARYLIGIGLAWICLTMAALAGSSVEFSKTSGSSYDFESFIIKPLIWIACGGLIPSILLGLIFAATIKKRID